jgi:hypothetical protein
VKPLVYLLVVAQLLLAVPAMAFATGGDPMGMAAMSTSDHCHCCPAGAQSMQDCLAACTLAAAAAPTMQGAACTMALPARVDVPLPAPLDSVSIPPLKPPPIR